MRVTDEEILAKLPKAKETTFIADGITTVHLARLLGLSETATRNRLYQLQAKRLVSGDRPPREGQGAAPIYWVSIFDETTRDKP